MRDAIDLDEVYRRATPVFFKTLGALAAGGFPIQPADARDIIHAFLDTQWKRLLATYDPGRGAFDPYLYRAFSFYARREALRRARDRGRQLDPQALVELAGAASGPAPDQAPDTARVRRAVASLDPTLGRALDTFLTHRSEQAAADALGWTRHKLRTTLAEAVARVALRFDRPAHVAPDDWALTRRVLGTGCTPRQAARELGRDPATATQTHRRTLAGLLQALKA